MTAEKIQIDKKDWGVSFGEMVRREFFKSRVNRLCLWYVLFLFALAVFAPFIANDKPYVIKMDGGFKFPLFAALTATDYSILLAAALGVVLVLLYGRNVRKVDPSTRGKVFSKQLWSCVIILLVGIAVLYSLVPKRLDATNYKKLVETGQAEWGLFTPVPYGYARTNLSEREQPPSKEHLMGTDDVGSDVLCRLIHGSRISLSVGFVAVGISTIIGVVFGAVMGYFGGAADFVGMRFVEIMMAIPVLLLILTIIAFFPRSLFIMMVVIGVTSWTGDARFIRAEFLRLRNQDFVQAARALGLPINSILFRHMLPNGIAPVLVNATFGVAGAIFLEAALSFLGFGVVPPTPSWGQMLSVAVGTTGRFYWWLSLFPGMAIFLTVMSYNLIGEGLRDAIDPRLRKAV